MRVTNLKYIGFGVLVEIFRWMHMLTYLYILIERGNILVDFLLGGPRHRKRTLQTILRKWEPR
jgi:hypothetical protein